MYITNQESNNNPPSATFQLTTCPTNTLRPERHQRPQKAQRTSQMAGQNSLILHINNLAHCATPKASEPTTEPTTAKPEYYDTPQICLNHMYSLKQKMDALIEDTPSSRRGAYIQEHIKTPGIHGSDRRPIATNEETTHSNHPHVTTLLPNAHLSYSLNYPHSSSV